MHIVDRGKQYYADTRKREPGDIHLWSDGKTGLVVEAVVEENATVQDMDGATIQNIYQCRAATPEEIEEYTRPLTDEEKATRKAAFNDFFDATETW